MSAAPEGATKKKRGKMIVLAILMTGVIGGGAGFFAPKIMLAEAKPTEAEAVADIRNMEVGRIVVNLQPSSASAVSAKHLVIETIIEYDAAKMLPEGGDGEGPDVETFRPKVRDAFNEYLANISEAEVRGSSGMSVLREELLRRARVAFTNDAPTALLIQDYVLQ